MLHSCVQFQISLVIGGHRISAASAKMVSSGVKLEFATPALWRFGKMECSHLWHQPREAHWYCVFCSEWKQLTRETNSWAEFLNIMLQQGKITCRVQRNRLLCQAQQFNPCLQRKVHFIVERTGRSRKNCYSFSFFPNDLFDNFLQFNFWTNWSLQGNTACSRQFWWKRLRTNYTTQCQHKDVSKDFRTRNYRLPSTKPPEMENYPGVANPDWSSAQGKTVTRCIIWRLFKKYYDSRKWARDEASPGPSIHSRKGRDGDTQTHQIIILGVS